MKEIIVVSKSMGVYLGSFLGLGFWSKIDAAGQPSAVTFENETALREFTKGWETPLPNDISFLEVNIDEPPYWASMKECVKAGAEPWEL